MDSLGHQAKLDCYVTLCNIAWNVNGVNVVHALHRLHDANA